MKKIIYEPTDIVVFYQLENRTTGLLVAKDIYEAVDRIQCSYGLLMKAEILGFAGDLFHMNQTEA